MKILVSIDFFRVLQILLYPAKAYHSQTKNIKVVFDFGGRFFATLKKKRTQKKRKAYNNEVGFTVKNHVTYQKQFNYRTLSMSVIRYLGVEIIS